MPRTAEFDRQAVVDRAVTLFWERGYFATSIKALGEALELRPGSLYAAFGSKEGLFLEALDRYHRAMGEVLAKEIRDSPSIMDGIGRYLHRLADACATPERQPARACMLIKTLLEVNQHEPALQQRVNGILDGIEQDLNGLLEQAKQQDELKQDVDCARLARFIQAQIIALRTFAQRHTGPQHVHQLATDVVALLDGYRK